MELGWYGEIVPEDLLIQSGIDTVDTGEISCQIIKFAEALEVMKRCQVPDNRCNIRKIGFEVTVAPEEQISGIGDRGREPGIAGHQVPSSECDHQRIQKAAERLI